MPLEALNDLLDDETGGVFFLPRHAAPREIQAAAKRAKFAFFHIEGKNISRKEQLLKVHVPASLEYGKAFNELFYRSLREYSLLSVETLRDGTLVELMYSVEFKPGTSDSAFVDELRKVSGGGQVALLTGRENIDV